VANGLMFEANCAWPRVNMVTVATGNHVCNTFVWHAQVHGQKRLEMR
jgi:hypothetical protein